MAEFPIKNQSGLMSFKSDINKGYYLLDRLKSKKMQTDKFLLSCNVLADPNNFYWYINHIQYPRFLVKIKDFESEEEFLDYEGESLHTYTFTYDIYDSMYLVTFEVLDNIDNARREDLDPELKLAADWYKEHQIRQYCNNIDLFQDYDEKTPGLKVVRYSNPEVFWVVYYQKTHRAFVDLEELDKYLHSFGFEDFPETGVINSP